MKKTCYIQDICPKFSAGDNKPPNNDVRHKYPCASFIACDCKMYLNLHNWIEGKGIACKIRRAK